MIEGLKIDLSTEKLKRHLKERAEYHKSKAAWYKSKAKEIKKHADPESAPGGYSNSNPISSFTDHCRTHQGRATFFLLLAGNLVPQETYRLSESDLERLEMVSRFF